MRSRAFFYEHAQLQLFFYSIRNEQQLTLGMEAFIIIMILIIVLIK